MKSAALAALLLLLPQDSEFAPTSKVTGSALPAGALRALDAAMIRQIGGMLAALYKDVKLEGIEVLLWQGEYLGEKGAGLRKKAAGLLEKDGFTCAEEASPQKIEGREVFVCSATKAGRRVLGMWIGSAEAAMLAWARSPAAAEGETSFGNVIYAAPKGWKVETAADGVTLTPTDLLPEEKLFVLILPGKEAQGTLEESAEALWAETCQAFQVDGGKLGTKDVYTSLKGWKYFRHYCEVRPQAGRLFLSATFIQVGNRFERVAALTNYVNRPYDETPLYSPKYYDTFNRFVFGLKFKNHPEPDLAEGSLKGEGIVGVWMGLGLQFNAQQKNLQYQAVTLAFYSNGQVFYNSKLQTFLFEGMSPILAREVTPRWWGNYRFDQGSGTIKMSYTEIPMELRGEHLILTTNKTEHKFGRLARVDGTRLDGTWTFSEYEGKIPKITFTEQGRFTDEGAVKVLEHSLYKLYSTGGKPGEGTYEVRNWTLLLHYADGREFTTAFLGLGAEPGDHRPAELVLGFNHDKLQRQ